MDDVAFWDMVGALAQIAAAVATFAAVIVSLRLAVWERRPRLRLTVTVSSLVGEGWDDDFVSFEVVNRGARPAKITGYGWRTGWFKKRHMVINHGQWHAYQPELPFALPPGDQVTFMVPVDAFLEEAERLSDSFTVRLPTGHMIDRRLTGHIWTADGFSVLARASQELRRLLLDRDPSTLLGSRMRKLRHEKGSYPSAA